MTIFTWLVILIIAATFLFQGNKKPCPRFIIIAFLLLFALMGLRDIAVIGNDSQGSYYLIYHTLGRSEWNQLYGSNKDNYNIGFSYLNKLIYEVSGGNYQFFIILIAFFVMFSYMRFIKKYSVSPVQSVLYFLGLLYYTFLFDVLKQAIAMSVLLYAFDAIIEKKPIKFIILVALASTFHFPALIFLPAYWIGQMKVGQGYVFLLAAMLLITYMFRDQLLNLMLDAYINEDIEATMEGIRFLPNKVIIMLVIVLFAVLIRPPLRENSTYSVLLMFVGVAIILQTFSGYNNIFERLADYYFHTAIIFIPFIFERNEKSETHVAIIKNSQIIGIAVLVICAFAIWRFLSYVNNSRFFIPYRFFWQ